MYTKLGQCNAFPVSVIIVMGTYIVIKYVMFVLTDAAQFSETNSLLTECIYRLIIQSLIGFYKLMIDYENQTGFLVSSSCTRGHCC